MSKRKLFENIIWSLPISSIKKFELSREMNIAYNVISGKSELNGNVALINSNSYYGHEYWMKRYSKWENAICGVIEHGVYFGNNMSMVGDPRDYYFKNVLTFGDYREELLGKAFPDFRVIKIGPRIAYAKTNSELFETLTIEAKGASVLTLFPAHSLEGLKCEYDINYLIDEARKIMDERKIKCLRVCLKEQDMKNGTAEKFVRRGCSVVTAGAASVDFLPRLRAIIESSSLTVSNSLGTHVGYCIYLQKPHFLISQDRIDVSYGNKRIEETEQMDLIKNSFRCEEGMFIKKFSSNNELCITDEQYDLCDYYWGFNHVKEPSEMYKVLESLYHR